MNDPVDILILSNGPGELATWVQPVVRELRRQLGDDRSQVRLSLVLSPCAYASGREGDIARCYPELDRIQRAEHFWKFLVYGKTADQWDWRDRGIVIFLGGDQFFPIVIGKRLGYRTVIYAEWEARWHRWGDRFAVMKPEVLRHVAPQNAHKFSIVGDLMAEVECSPVNSSLSTPHASISSAPLIGLLPGSKPMKLTMGVPLTLAIAEHIHHQRPEVQFVIPVAPTIDGSTLATFADPDCNPVIRRVGWATAKLMIPDEKEALPYLQTSSGVNILLWTGFPAYDLLSRCELCLTTLGANTAELGALAVPMIVMLPTQQLDVMRAWEGIPGLLVNLPGVGSLLATVINWVAVRNIGLRAWPNMWAQREIVPERVGRLEPKAIAEEVIHYLDNPTSLAQMRQALRSVRGQPGAATNLVKLVQEELDNSRRSSISSP